MRAAGCCLARGCVLLRGGNLRVAARALPTTMKPGPSPHALSPPAHRLSKIAVNLSLQDKKRADYKKTLPVKPQRQGLLQWVKKSAWEKD